MIRPLAAMALAALLTSCATPPSEVPEERALGTPKQTVEYLRWALTQAPETDRPNHLWNCLSTRFIAENRITREDLNIFWSRVRDTLQQYLGDIEQLETGALRDLGARKTELDLESGPHRATLLFVLETDYEIRPASRARESVFGTLPSMESVLRYDGDRALITIPGVERPIEPESVFRVTIENGWKIERIVRHNLHRLESLAAPQAP
jgi:hypothetical protein